jgi:hypothetical protein
MFYKNISFVDLLEPIGAWSVASRPQNLPLVGGRFIK